MPRITLFAVAGLVLALTTGAVALPLWPADAATYIKETTQHLAAIADAAQASTQRLSGKLDELPAGAEDDIAAAADFFTDEPAPPKLAPLQTAGQYAASICASSIGYLGSSAPEMASNPFSAPMLFSMAMSCNEAIQAARMEIARAVAAVGSYPAGAK